MSEHTTTLYFECHITIEPVYDDRLETFARLCKNWDFHVAKLLMQKRVIDKPERNSKDSFCTGRSKEYADLFVRMECLIEDLKRERFKVWRYKIENTLIDSKYGDDSVLLSE